MNYSIKISVLLKIACNKRICLISCFLAMILFLLFSIPVFYLFALLYTTMREKRFEIDFITFFKGAAWFIPSLVVISIIQNVFSLSYKPVAHFFYYFYRDHLLYSLLGVVGFCVFFGMYRSPKQKNNFLLLITFFSGYFTLVSINNFFAFFGEFDFHTLFLLPIVRIFTIIALSLVMERFLDEVSVMKIIYGASMIIIPVAGAFVSLTYMRNLDILAFFLALVFLAGSCALYYLWKEF
jgi:hypothetical protein